MDNRISDADEAWVQLTATELYADFCNSGQGHVVVERALRLGILRGHRDDAAERANLDAIEQKILDGTSQRSV